MKKNFVWLALFVLGIFVGQAKDALWPLGLKSSKKKQVPISQHAVTEHKPFVVIVPSYNNGEWVEKNLRSLFEQKYDNYRLIFIDDASKDGTLSLARNLIAAYGQEHRTEVWHNADNKGAVENIYRAVHSCLDQEIIILLDGDDWLSHEHVLKRLNEKYADPQVWATYGSYIEYPSYSYTVANFAARLPERVVLKNQVRAYSKEHWCISHMRTFYAGLFKQIQLKDILFEGKYYDAAADVAFMVPLAEMAGEHMHFIEDIFYIYNRASALNDNKLRAERQKCISEHIFSLPSYARRSWPFIHREENTVHLIAFSFDRPMQLYALLESVERYGMNLNAITVIYRTSVESYEKGYAEVKKAFPHVHFVHQGLKPLEEFQPMVMEVLQKSPENYVTWAVDDLILTDTIDFKEGARLIQKTGAYCFCYRLGHDVDYCYMLDTYQGIPPLVQVEEDVFAWMFEGAQGDWNYKTTVDLGLYQKEMLIEKFKKLMFVHPNSLETEWHLKEKKGGIGLCCFDSKMVNLPINQVYISSNRSMQSYSTEDLLSKFQAGFKIDIEQLHRIKNHSAHMEWDIPFVRRK